MSNTSECKILLVDDMEMNLVILSEIIKSIGYTPLMADSAKAALDILRNELPQLILLDVSMPDMTGLEFCQLLKEDVYTREIPVIFISAMDSQDDLAKAFEIGAVDYIFKPFEPNDVKMRVNTHLKIYQMQQELEAANRELNAVIKQQMKKTSDKQKSFYSYIGKMLADRDKKRTYNAGSESHMARILAQAMQFSDVFEKDISEGFIAGMELAATVHDIGLLKVPESILLKEGALTEAERAIVRNHVVPDDKDEFFGKMDESFDGMEKMILDVICYHHERFDGQGYPNGLKGKDIPLAARIMAVIDAYDAMVNDRCYHKAVTAEEAMAILENEAGAQFDPDIIAVFKKVQRQFINN